MTEGEDQEKKNESKGFAGLSSMVSNVESAVAHAKHENQNSASSPTNTERPSQQLSAATEICNPLLSDLCITTWAQPQPTEGSSTGKWLLGMGFVIFFLWLASESGNKTSPPPQAYTPSTEQPAAVSTSPTWQPSVAQPQVPSRPSEERPQVGRGLILSSAQIRYCLAENIRMTASEDVISEYNDSDINRFNKMVADYNSRCSSFKYQHGDLERAQLEIEIYRTALIGEGRVRFNYNQSNASEINKKIEDEEPISTIDLDAIESPSQAINFPTPSEIFIAKDWTWGEFRRRVSYLRLSVPMQKAAWLHYLDKIIPRIAEMEGKVASEEQLNFISLVPKPGETSSITGKFIIKTEAANIRNQPSAGESSTTLAEASRNEILNVSGYSGDFFVVTNSSGVKGYVHRSTGSYLENQE